MESSTYPFPLAVNSSHHSHYHRFLLGADPRVIAPFPKPYCVGSLDGPVRALAENLSLPRWRKLFHGSLPWIDGFGPEHYALGTPAPHCPLPAAYGRPARRFGAYDFVQVADPSVSALALVAGDRRVIERFVCLGDGFCNRLETGAHARNLVLSGSRATRRMLAGQFFEPNNRWLMPFLHVHSRVLNLTSFAGAPGRLACIDAGALARAGARAQRDWVDLQGEMLSALGYRAHLPRAPGEALTVDGVSPRLLATMEAPRIAVLRLLERMVVGDREPSAERLEGELPRAVIAAMADRLESLLAGNLSFHKPPKVDLPCEGPWRAAVRGHLFSTCRSELTLLDTAAARAKSEHWDCAVFPTPRLDPAHSHAPAVGEPAFACQLPTDPELGSDRELAGAEVRAPQWLAREFEGTLSEVNERLVRDGTRDPVVSLRRLLPCIDHLGEGASPEQLEQAGLFLGAELERRSRQPAGEAERGVPHLRVDRFPLAPLEELFEGACIGEIEMGREIGGRSR